MIAKGRNLYSIHFRVFLIAPYNLRHASKLT